jgi:hypothetical protein
MTDAKYFLDLDFDVTNALSASLDLDALRLTGEDPSGAHDIWCFMRDDLDKIFDAEWINRLESLGLSISYALVFYRKDNYFHPHAHVDTLGDENFDIQKDSIPVINYGVNFVLDAEDDSEMIWYELDPRDGTIADNFLINNGRGCSTWDLNHFYGKEVARKTIGRNLVLVNTAVPHTVQTFNKTRWSFSLRFTDLDRLSWNEAVDKFSKLT